VDAPRRLLGVLLLAHEVELGDADIGVPGEPAHLVQRGVVADGVGGDQILAPPSAVREAGAAGAAPVASCRSASSQFSCSVPGGKPRCCQIS
jgi:hypothetical protein